MQPTEPTLFKFESDFVASLRCIPMVVRYKLDTCGIKLKLDQWNRFSNSDRQALVTLPCDRPAETTAYRQTVTDLIWHYAQTPAAELPIAEHPPWMEQNTIPDSVQAKAQTVGVSLEVEQWRSLNPLQRFALIKLSRSSHENKNFKPALAEFQQKQPK